MISTQNKRKAKSPLERQTKDQKMSQTEQQNKKMSFPNQSQTITIGNASLI